MPSSPAKATAAKATALATDAALPVLQKLTSTIKRLEKLEDFPVWVVRVQAAFLSSTLWSKEGPVDSPLTNAVMLTLIDDYFVNQLLDGDLKASTIWKHISGLYNVSDLASKTIALTELIAFDYSASTMLENKTKLFDLQRHLKSAFGGSTNIESSELVVLFALVNLPAAYVSLRITSTNAKDEPISAESLFSHLSSEEKTQTVSSTSLASRATSIVSPNSLCPHQFAKSKCFTCTPSSRPTCPLCVSAGLPGEQTRHKKGHPRLCKNRSSPPLSPPTGPPFTSGSHARSAKSSGVGPSAVSEGVTFVVDSGSTDHDVFNKDNVNIYSQIHHPIGVANGQFKIATAVGSPPSAVLPLKEVFVVPGFRQNLLSASKLDKDGYDTLFSNGRSILVKNLSLRKF